MLFCKPIFPESHLTFFPMSTRSHDSHNTHGQLGIDILGMFDSLLAGQYETRSRFAAAISDSANLFETPHHHQGKGLTTLLSRTRNDRA